MKRACAWCRTLNLSWQIWQKEMQKPKLLHMHDIQLKLHKTFLPHFTPKFTPRPVQMTEINRCLPRKDEMSLYTGILAHLAKRWQAGMPRQNAPLFAAPTMCTSGAKCAGQVAKGILFLRPAVWTQKKKAFSALVFLKTNTGCTVTAYKIMGEFEIHLGHAHDVHTYLFLDSAN